MSTIFALVLATLFAPVPSDLPEIALPSATVRAVVPDKCEVGLRNAGAEGDDWTCHIKVESCFFYKLATPYGLYRWLFSSQDLGSCAFRPSCSRFSQSAISTCGFVKGLLLTLDRLQRCHPFATSFYDVDPKTGSLIDPVESYCKDTR